MVEILLPQLKTEKINLTWSRNSSSLVISIVQLLANSSHLPSCLTSKRKEGDRPLPSVEGKRTQVKEPKKCKKYWPILVKYFHSNSLGTLKGQLSLKRGTVRSKFWKISMILIMWHLRLGLFGQLHRICLSFIAL